MLRQYTLLFTIQWWALEIDGLKKYRQFSAARYPSRHILAACMLCSVGFEYMVPFATGVN